MVAYAIPNPSVADHTCTRADPCSIVQSILAAAGGRTFIALAPGSYNGPISIGASVDTTFSGPSTDPGQAVVTTSEVGSANALFTLDPGGHLTLEGMTITGGPAQGVYARGMLTLFAVDIRGNGAAGIEMHSAAVTISQSRVADNRGVGVNVVAQGNGSGAGIDMERSYVGGNTNGGMRLGGKISVVNSFIVDNGTPAGTIGGISIVQTDGSPVLDFLTIADNTAGSGTTGGITCSAGAHVTSSIIANNAPLVTGQATGECTVVSSLIEPGSGSVNNNIHGDPQFAGDYHLSPSSPAINNAQDSPLRLDDFDGDARPQGGAWDMGADEAP